MKAPKHTRRMFFSACIALGGSNLAMNMPSADAENVAQTQSVKLGYFFLQKVKQAYPEASAAAVLEERAKEMMKREVDKGNAELAELQKSSKSKEEIEKRVKELQHEINVKQETLGALVGTQGISSQNSIIEAVHAIAKERGLDVVVDGTGVYAGAEKFNEPKGEDITAYVIRKLNPATESVENTPKPASSTPPK